MNRLRTVADDIEVAILGTQQQVTHTVTIPIDRRRAGGVAGQNRFAYITHIRIPYVAILLLHVAEPCCILAVDNQIEATIVVPIREANLTTSRLTGNTLVKTQHTRLGIHHALALIIKRAVRAVEDTLAGLQHQLTLLRAETLEVGQVPLRIQHHEVHQTILVPIHRHGGRAPLRRKGSLLGLPPIPLHKRHLILLPRHAYRLRSLQLEAIGLTRVAQPLNLSKNRVDEHILTAITVPIGHRQHRVAPLLLGRALNRTIVTGLDAQHLTIDLEELGSTPRRLRTTRQVANQGNLAGRITGYDILLAIAIPIDRAGGSQGPKFHQVSLLTQVIRILELRHTVLNLTRMAQPCHTTILIAYNQIDMAIAIEIRHDGDNHLEVETNLALTIGHTTTRLELRLATCTLILVPRQSIEELTANDIQIAITIKVGNAGIRGTIGVDNRITGHHLTTVDVLPIHTLEPIYIAVQRTTRPLALSIVGIIPAVVIPRIDTDNDILIAIMIPIHIVPHVATRLVVGSPQHLTLILDGLLLGIGSLHKVGILHTFGQHILLAVDLREANVVQPLGVDALGRSKQRLR